MNLAVFDTNVIVSGFLSPQGPPGRIVEWLRTGSVRAVLDDRVFNEYATVLNRSRFGLPPAEVRIVLDAIRRRAQWVSVGCSAPVGDLPDPNDAPFLECAHAEGVVLVTGNVRHYPPRVVRGARIVTPAAFVAAAGTPPPAAT